MNKKMKKVIHRRFLQYGMNAREFIHKCKLLLPVIAKERIWKDEGFGSIYEYAAKLAGMSRHSVDDALRILKRIEDKPALQEIVEAKGINSVRPVLAIATEETQEFWAKKANEMSKHTLETYVKNYREEFRTGTGLQSEEGAKSERLVVQEDYQQEVSMKLRPDLACKLQQLQKRHDFEELLEKFVETVEAAEEEEKPEAVRTQSRHVPAKIRRFVLAKTGGKCAFPGCNRQHEFLHHTQRFASERIHDPDRLVPLCKAHERIAHLGLIANEEGPTSEWQLRAEADPTDMKNYVDQFVGLYR